VATTALQDPKVYAITSNWTWLTDYAYLTAEWTIDCEEGRTCLVGSGMKVGGKPRGTIRQVKGHATFRTYGLGAIHARCTDTGVRTCAIRLTQGTAEPLPVYRGEIP